ncbi:glycosyltransferase family 4 protein [Aequorivita sp. CIP111184]|uniref:glycosyltransferase family 4 protein n=1 Tax=Aequorivita sp. CIP111184 TaxID=2211356 RepID=UPI000DBC0F3D|nr:glycosyltransferase family 4 protein [Aequorivita sp. CIP111184]SRX54895.1 N, N'-diacetylbacillosaminyl-diphospho-undecaprenol alpha-1,3-N-acetylgalactosaminyltransferase [Aequorivita sp. CIP111184]
MKPRLIRITTVPMSLEKLLEGQLEFMQDYFQVIAISADLESLEVLGKNNGYETYHVEMTRQITPISDIKSLYKLYKYFKKEKPTIVHTHTPKAGIVGMMAAWLARIPNRLHTVAGLPLMEATGKKRKLLDFVEKLTYRFATKVYPNSKGLYDFIVAENLAKPEKLKIIGQGSSNGINTQYFDPSIFTAKRNTFRQELNIPADSFVFVFVGRLVGDKGINELVQAFSKLNSEFRIQDSKLLLVGPFEGELDPLKRETITAIENNPNIISVGYQNDVRPYFAAADALVFPSYREGFPNVAMQAGAMGLPSIVSDINGCNEIIIPNVNGLIIPPKNTEALAEAMQLLINDIELYNRLKSNARIQITSRYERQQVWDALLAEYQSLLEEKK